MPYRDTVPMGEFTEYMDVLGLLYAPSGAPNTLSEQ